MTEIKVKHARNWIDKLLGQIGKNKAVRLYMKTRFGIHTFGLKFPIDVIILNRRQKVVSLKNNLKPNRFFFWNPAYDTILELPQGFIEDKKITLNEIINIR